jgi:hypothetical protein
MAGASGIPGSGISAAEAAKTSNGLTGFGATNASWNHHHRADTRFDPGSAYDPDPSLGDHQRFDSRYYAVNHEAGRVTNYSMRFPSRTGVGNAKASILSSEFPPDAKIVWFKRKGTCAQMYVRSAKLARATHSGALVEFTSGDAGTYYDARAVGDAILVGLPEPATSYDC